MGNEKSRSNYGCYGINSGTWEGKKPHHFPVYILVQSVEFVSVSLMPCSELYAQSALYECSLIKLNAKGKKTPAFLENYPKRKGMGICFQLLNTSPHARCFMKETSFNLYNLARFHHHFVDGETAVHRN